MSRAFFAIGEFTFNMVKIWVAFDLVKAISTPKRKAVTERSVIAVMVITISGVTTWNTCTFGNLFSNNMLWLSVLIMWCGVPILYRVSRLSSLSVIYLYCAAVHLVDFLIQSVVYYTLDFLKMPVTLLLKMDGKRGVYLLFFSLACIWFGRLVKCNLSLFQNVRRKGLIQLAGIFAASILLVYFQRIYIFLVSEQYVTRWVVFLLVVTIFSCVGVVCVQRGRMKDRERIHNIKLELLEANYEQATRMYKEKATLLHDEKHHINAIYELLNRGETSRAMQYVRNISLELENSGSRIWSNHSMLDMILNMKSEEAEKHQIDIDIRFDDMRGLAVNDADLCTLISNLLDNAIEANLKIAETEKRWIRFYGERKGTLWVLNSSNPTNEPAIMEKGRLLTSKQDKAVHGFGMNSIRHVLDKYCGDMNIVIQDGEFILTSYMVGFK